MNSYAADLARLVLKRSGYVPNVGNLDVRPGTILSVTSGRYQIEGTLDRRVADRGDAATAAKIKAAMDRIDPAKAPDAADRKRHQLGLSYKSEGTTIVAPKGGVELKEKIPGVGEVAIKVDVLMSFKTAKSFLFDTTKPAPWFTFSPNEMNEIAPAALEHLNRGELLVTGVVKCETWVWYISKASEGAVGFTFDAGLPAPPTVNVTNFADLKAAGGLQVTYDKNEVVDGQGSNSVAAFACLVKRKPFLGDEVVDPHLLAPQAIDFEGGGGGAIAGSKIKDVLGAASEEEILPLVRLPEDL